MGGAQLCLTAVLDAKLEHCYSNIPEGHQLSSQEIMQNLLNGKNVNEIEFRPQKLTPDNIFGNNVDSDNQNVLETDKDKENASVSEEKTESSLSPIKDEQDFSNFVHKAQDPMNMSFYQDEDEETAFSSNPFDLNKVQLLPENVDEFIQQPESPLGVPLAKSPLLGPNRESPVPISNKLEVSKSPGSKSLVEIANSPVRDVPKSDSPICSGAKTPEIPTSTNTGKSEYLSRLESEQQNEENERESLNSELISGTDSGAFLFDSNSIPAQYSDQFRDENLSKITEVTETSFTSAVSSEIVNSFLERSAVPEVTSPLSPSEEIEKFQTEPPENFKLELKCEIIKPEFPVHTITSPSEESKGTDTPPSTPAIICPFFVPKLKMDHQEQKDYQFTNYFISQRSEYLSRLESEQQNEENERESLMQQKKICEEKSDACCELEVQNEFIQIDLCAEKQKQQNLANKITLTQQIISDTIENFNKMRNLMQLCINCLEDTDVSKQKVVTILEKLNSRLNAEEQHHVKRLNDSKQCLTDCKEEHILRIEQIHRNIEQKFIEIRTKERDFFNLLNQTTNIKNKKEKYKEEINAREYEFSNLSSECLELQTYLENLTKCKEVKELQLITKSSDWEAESRKLAEMYLNLQTGLSESQNELSCKNELFKSLENKTESLESCLLDLNTALYNTEKEKTDLEGGFRMDLKNYDGKLEVLQKQIEESKSTSIILEQNNELLNQELCEMETNMTEMKTQLDNTDSDLTRYKKELNQTQTVYGEQCLKFESEIISLKQILDAEIQTEMKDINLKSNLKVSLDELNKQYENIIAQKEKACIEAEEEEVTANIDTDSIKDEIIKQKAAIDILLNEIAKCKILQNEKIETVKKQTEEEIKNKNLQFDNLRTELSERMSNEKKLFLDELNKLKNNKQTLELQTLEIKVSTQSLELEIRAKDEEFLHLLKQKSEAVNKSKIGGNQEPRTDKCVFKVPKFHIPPFKYSSSESSMDEKPLQKRRKILTRKPSGKMTVRKYKRSIAYTYNIMSRESCREYARVIIVHETRTSIVQLSGELCTVFSRRPQHIAPILNFKIIDL